MISPQREDMTEPSLDSEALAERLERAGVGLASVAMMSANNVEADCEIIRQAASELRRLKDVEAERDAALAARLEGRAEAQQYYETGLEAGRAEGSIVKAELEAAEARIKALEGVVAECLPYVAKIEAQTESNAALGTYCRASALLSGESGR